MRWQTPMLCCALLVVPGCFTDGMDAGPPVPASSDPTGKDLVVGAVVAAVEKGGGVRLYKVTEVIYFPPPMTDELVMIAYNEKGNDFRHAAALWRKGGLTVALNKVRVQRHMFRTRDYRVLTSEPVTAADLSATPSKPPAPR
jgi:hypothetical protein